MVKSIFSAVDKEPNIKLDEFEYRYINPSLHPFEMPAVWQLVANNLVANGYVNKECAMAAAKDTFFDNHPNTRVVAIYHHSGELAGTFSLTLNSSAGMPISKYFNQPLQALEKQYRLMNGWRFSMSAKFQSARLRQRSNALYHQLIRVNDVDASVLYYHERLDGYYHRLFNGQKIAGNDISFDGETQMPVCMMLCKAEQNPPHPKYMHQGLSYEHTIIS